MGDSFQPTSSCKILIVDDDPAMRSLLLDELWENGCSVIESPNGSDAISQVKSEVPSLIITDLSMPGGGFDYLQALIASAENCPIILITAFGNSQTKRQAETCGVAAYFDKPVRVKDLKLAIQQVCPMVASHTCPNTVFWKT
ncbi:MAG: response regulator transcription factor [Nitrospirales bacterium]